MMMRRRLRRPRKLLIERRPRSVEKVISILLWGALWLLGLLAFIYLLAGIAEIG